MKFRNPYEEYNRTPEMCLSPEQLGLRPLDDLDSLPNVQIAAAFTAATIIHKHYRDAEGPVKSSDSPERAAMRGAETYMAYCIYLLREKNAAAELSDCLKFLSNNFHDGIAILGLIYSITGKDVDDLLEEAQAKLGQTVDENLPFHARAKLREALKDVIG